MAPSTRPVGRRASGKGPPRSVADRRCTRTIPVSTSTATRASAAAKHGAAPAGGGAAVAAIGWPSRSAAAPISANVTDRPAGSRTQPPSTCSPSGSAPSSAAPAARMRALTSRAASATASSAPTGVGAAVSNAAESVSAAAHTILSGATARIAAAASRQAASSLPPDEAWLAARWKEPSSSSRSAAAVPGAASHDVERRAMAVPVASRSGPAASTRRAGLGSSVAAAAATAVESEASTGSPSSPRKRGARVSGAAQVPAAELRRILTGGGRGLVDRALEREAGGRVGAARGAGGRAVRAHGDRLDAQRRRAVEREGVPGGRAQQFERAVVGRADVHEQVERDRRDRPAAQADPHAHPLRGPAGRRRQLLSGAQRQPCRPARAQRDRRAQVLGHEVRASRGAAGHQRAHDADARRRQREPLGEDPAHVERRLRRGAHDQAPVLVQPRRRDRRLERDRRRERHVPHALDHDLAAPELLLGLPAARRQARRDAGRVGRRGTGVESRGQRLVVDSHRLRRTPGELGVLGRGRGDAVADVGRLAAQQARNVARGEHRGHAGEREGGRGVGGSHARARVGRAAQREVQKPGRGDVAGERGVARDAAQGHERPRAPAAEHGRHRPRVAAAAAQARELLAHLLLGRVRHGVEQRPRREDHPRRAEAALDGARLGERRLDRVGPVDAADALDRRHGAALRADGQREAGRRPAGRRAAPCTRRSARSRSPP